MDDYSRRVDIKPDPDMVALSSDFAVRASEAVGQFHRRMSWQLGVDGSHASSHRAVIGLAESLEETCKSLRRCAAEGEKRVMSKCT